MKPYYKLDDNVLYNGDCLEVLKEIDDNSIDLLVSDPPYGYSFMGKDWDSAFVAVEVWKECLRVLKEGAFAFIMSAPRQDCMSEMIVRLRQAGFQTGFTSIYWTYASGFPKAGNIGKMVDKKMGAEREVVGEKIRVGDKKPYKLNQKESDFMNYENNPETAPATEQAKSLDGSYAGFQPKPAVEVILVVMKPLSEKTYVEQALKNGKGITWLDRCRIPYESEGDLKQQDNNFKSKSADSHSAKSTFTNIKDHTENKVNNQGRFPANLLVSDDVLNDSKIYKSGAIKPHHSCKSKPYKDGSTFKIRDRSGEYNYDESAGSFSRYFDLDKWFCERIKQLPESVRKVFPFLIVPKASKGEKNKGCDGLEEKECQPAGLVGAINKGTERPRQARANIHPTAKPIKLMSYLIELGSSKGDVVLDPFLGSGTTCISADILGRKWIGIEREKEYIEIAMNRIKDEARQIKLF